MSSPDELGISLQTIEHSDAAKKHKKKKRRRELGHETDDTGERKKKKKRRTEETTVRTGETCLPEAQSQVEEPRKRKKSSKKKDKGKQPESGQLDIDPTASPSNLQASATALLSAIAAASASDPALHIHPQQVLENSFDHAILSNTPHQPFIPYPYIPPNAFPGISSATQALPIFPNSGNVPFSELTFASNDDVLRALQALDVTKITNALKNLGDAPGSSVHSGPSHFGQVPVSSDTLLGMSPEKHGHPMNPGRSTDMSLPAIEQRTNPDHAYILANKWLNAAKLAELVKTDGLVYKKGKFSAIEEQQLKDAVERYRITRELSEEQMNDLIYPKSEKSRDNAFWSEITNAVPQRPIIAVYHHIRRSYHPWKKLGPWKCEEDAILKQTVADLGQQWEKVSQIVGRMSSDCRDRYRNHIADREARVTGPWSKQEEEELTRIVTEMTVKQGKDTDNDVFWGRVSELMGNRRGRQQCRIKWTDALNKTFKNEGQKPRWGQRDAYILVHKVDSLNVRDDTEIDWKTISDPQWNLWSAHALQRRWLTMKRSIKGYEDMTHREIMDILRIKKAQMPVSSLTTTRKRKGKKVTSSASVVEDSPAGTPGVGSITGQSSVLEISGNNATADNSDSLSQPDSDS